MAMRSKALPVETIKARGTDGECIPEMGEIGIIPFLIANQKVIAVWKLKECNPTISLPMTL